MFNLRHARPLALVVGASFAISLSAGPADAASGTKTGTKSNVAASKAKSKSKTKAKVKTKTKAKSTGRADLATKAIHVDVTEDGTLLVNANLLNIGRKVASPSTVVIALSDDAKYDADDEVLSETDAPSIGFGVKRSISEEVEIPGDLDTTEEFTILVCADGYNTVAESNETNNCVAQALVIDDVPGSDDTGTDDSGTEDGGADDAPADEG